MAQWGAGNGCPISPAPRGLGDAVGLVAGLQPDCVTSYNGSSYLGTPGVTRTSKRRSLEPVCLHCRVILLSTAFSTEMGILLILGEGGPSLEYVFNLFSALSF